MQHNDEWAEAPTPEGDENQIISKTQRKKQMHDLQALGATLVKLPESRLKQLDLPEELRDAVMEARRLTRHEAIRRQMQYIGRVMRDVDPAPIQARLDEWNGQSRLETARMHLVERWRDRLISDDGAVQELAVLYPQADLQQLRTLIRNARREQAQNRPPKSSRLIYKMVRELVGAPPAAATALPEED